MKQRKSGPVRGLRVVSLARQMAARVAGMVLADYGATVVELRDVGFIAEPGWEVAEQVWMRGKILVAVESATELEAFLGEADIFITD